MAITEQQRADAIQAIDEKVKGPCPMCGNRAFVLADIAHVLPHDPSGALVLGKDTIPIVLVMCKNCKYLLPFAAVPMGITLKDESEAMP